MASNWDVIAARRDAGDSVHLTLEPGAGNPKAARTSLELLDAPPGVEGVIVGTTLEIGGLTIRVRGVEWASRHGAARARLVDRRTGRRTPA